MISVIVCFYEEYNYIGLALNSLRKQDQEKLEIVLIDDSNLEKNFHTLENNNFFFNEIL